MKKIIIVLSWLTAMLLTGCNKNDAVQRHMDALPDPGEDVTGNPAIPVPGTEIPHDTKVIIAGFMPFPAGNAVNGQYIQLLAVEDIDFDATPYAVFTASFSPAGNRATGLPVNGWVTGQQNGIAGTQLPLPQTTKFILTGQVKAGEFFYVGGSSRKLNGAGTNTTDEERWKRTIDNSGNWTGDDGIGGGAPFFFSTGVEPQGIAVFDTKDVTEETVPVDVVFVGNLTGYEDRFYDNSGGTELGYRICNNDRYSIADGEFFAKGANTYDFGLSNTARRRFYQFGGVYDREAKAWVVPRGDATFISLPADATVNFSDIETDNIPIFWGGSLPNTVYFSQNFNSSSSLANYQGPGTHQFTYMGANGTAELEIFDNKLRFIKNGGESGNNRVVVLKSPFNPSGAGGFLKFEMEVAVTNNTGGSTIDNGFYVSVGTMSTQNNANPPREETHSSFFINPAATPGAFVLRGGLDNNNAIYSIPLTGRQKLVWYINNSGDYAGYHAPDGTLSNVMDDAADVWAIGNDGTARLVLDDVPAEFPDLIGLRSFKISNNPNFLATLDVDNIEIKEEEAIKLKKITAISAVQPVAAPVKTIFSLLDLPKQVQVVLEDGGKQMVPVSWIETTAYNRFKTGVNEVQGTIVANPGTVNSDALMATIKVVMQDKLDIPNAFSPNGDGINDTWVIPDLQYYIRSSVEVFDRDGNRLFYSTDPKTGWNGRNRSGKVVPGSYSYIIKVPDLLLEKRGIVTVLK